MPPLEVDGQHAAARLAAPNLAETPQQAEHPSVLGEQVLGEAADAAGLGGAQQVVEQDRAQSPSLPGVLDGDGDLRRTRRLRRFVARDRTDMGSACVLFVGDEREARAVVDVREVVIPLGGQSVVRREEALVDRAGAEAVEELPQARLVGTNRADAQARAVAEGSPGGSARWASQAQLPARCFPTERSYVS